MQPDSPPRPASLLVTAFVVALSALLALGVVAELLFMVPTYEKLFAEFRMAIPWVTEVTIYASRWVVKYWYVVLLFGAVFLLPLVSLITWWLRHRSRVEWLAVVWCAVLIALPVSAGLIFWLAC